jgi:hypothetical protein
MEVNCVISECDAIVEHGVKAKDTFTHDRIYFLILRKLSYSQHLITELKDTRFDVLAVVNIKDYSLLGCVSPTLKMEAMESIYCTAT